MKRRALLLLTLVAACSPSDKTLPDPFKTTIAQAAEKLSSLDVVVDYEPNGEGCVQPVNGQLPPLDVPGDYCPAGPGTPQEPLLYQTGRKVRLFVTVTAIGSKSTFGFPVWGNIALTPSVGTIFSGTPTYMDGGNARRQRVQVMNTPGRLQIWAEAGTAMRMGGPDGEQVPPTFSGGASDILWFGHPSLLDVQRTDNDATSPLHGQRVDIHGDMLMVTRVGGNGFNVEEINADPASKQWNAVFAFAFNGVEGLAVGSRILKLGGAVTSFQGMTQVAEPEYVVAGGSCRPKAPAARYNVEELEVDDLGQARRARCPADAECVATPAGERCMLPNDPYKYDRVGRITCHTATRCGESSSECPQGTQCLDREDWNTTDENGQSAFTCQACPAEYNNADLWTSSCGPIYRGDEASVRELKLRNEALEGSLIKLNNVKVQGLNLSDDFFRSGFESFGQWKVIAQNGNCATVVSSEAAPNFDVLGLNARSALLQSVTGTLRQVRFRSGSAFWIVDVRHKDDLPLAP